jgi:hypothetical protein
VIRAKLERARSSTSVRPRGYPAAGGSSPPCSCSARWSSGLVSGRCRSALARSPSRRCRICRFCMSAHLPLARRQRGGSGGPQPPHSRQRRSNRPQRRGRARRGRRHNHRDGQGAPRLRPRHPRPSRNRLLSAHRHRPTLGAAVAAGLIADVLYGDPRRLHPVAGFGQLAHTIETVIWRPRRLAGALYVLALVGDAPADRHFP